MKKIILIILGLTIIASATLNRNNEVVTDSNTSLQWEDGDVKESKKLEDAIAYCEGLDLDSHTDWRLPNVNELKTIINIEKLNTAKIVDTFEHTKESYYWTSTSSIKETNQVFCVNFGNATINTTEKESEYEEKEEWYATRCVRFGN